MKNKYLKMKQAAKAVLLILLLTAVGMTKAMAQTYNYTTELQTESTAVSLTSAPGDIINAKTVGVIPYSEEFITKEEVMEWNYAITSFRMIDTATVAVLTGASDMILVYSLNENQILRKIQLPISARAFDYDNNLFHVIGDRTYLTIDAEGMIHERKDFQQPQLSNEEVFIITDLKVIDGQPIIHECNANTYSITSDGLQKIDTFYYDRSRGCKIHPKYIDENSLVIYSETPSKSGRNNVSMASLGLESKLACLNPISVDDDFIAINLQTTYNCTGSFVKSYLLVVNPNGELINLVEVPINFLSYISKPFCYKDNAWYYAFSGQEGISIFKIGTNTNRIDSPDSFLLSDYYYREPENVTSREDTSSHSSTRGSMDGWRTITQTWYNGNQYRTLEWTPVSGNIVNYCYWIEGTGYRPGYIKTPAYIATQPNEIKMGVPYKRAGFTKWQDFKYFAGLGRKTGNCYHPDNSTCSGECYWETTDAYVIGVDCSGFVSRCWEFSYAEGTNHIPDHCTPHGNVVAASESDFQKGDALNWAGHHVMLYTGHTSGTHRIAVFESTATDQVWRTVANDYDAVYFGQYGRDYKIHRLNLMKNIILRLNSAITMSQNGSTVTTVTRGQPLSVNYRVKNFGSETWSGDVRLFIEQSTGEEVPLNPVYSVTLAPGESQSFTFSNNEVISPVGTTKFYVRVKNYNAGGDDAYYDVGNGDYSNPLVFQIVEGENPPTPSCKTCPDYDEYWLIAGNGDWYYKSSSIGSDGCRIYELPLYSNYTYTFQTCDPGTASFDTWLYLLDANCNLVEDDDDGCTGRLSSLQYTITSSGYYYLKIVGYNGAEGSFTIAAKRETCSSPTVSISGNTSINYGESTTLTASGASSYSWSNGSTGSSITVSPTSTTTYTVTGTNSCGATGTASVTVTVSSPCSECPNYDELWNVNGSVGAGEWTTRSSSIGSGGCRIYKIPLASSYTYTFQTCCNGDADFDTRLYLYDASCNQVAYNDDYGGNTQSSFDYTNSGSTAYFYLKINGYSSSDYGSFTIAAKRVSSSFIIDVSASPSAGGSVSGAGTYQNGSTCTLIATPATGYSFVRWTRNGSQVSTNATYSFTVTESASYVAVFSLNSYNVSASANPTAGGSVSGGGSYNYGSNCTLTATPATGYSFVRWTKNGTQVSTNATYSFTVTESASYVAVFSLNSYNVSASANPTAGGTVSGGGSYNYGSNCTLTATSNTGYTFVRWTKNGSQVSTNASYSFTVTENASYVAVFSLNSYNVSASANPTAGGTVSGGGSYDYGSNCNLVATPATGYSFVRWTKNGSQVSTNASYSFTVTENASYVAVFSLNSYTVSASANPTAGGTVSGGGSYNYGSNCNLVATPATGYSFVRWTKNGSQVSTSATYSFTVTENATYVAVFSLNSYTVSASANPTAGGTVSGGGSYDYGSTCTLIATPVTSYTFLYWTENGEVVSTEATYSFTVTGDRNLVANFEAEDIIVFDDANVKALCIANWDTNGSGELSYAEAAAVTDLGGAFKENTTITSFEELQYFTGLTRIDNWAFYACSSLTAIEIPNSVTTIGIFAFGYCGLTGSLTIPNSVTAIQDRAFHACSGLTSVEIPNSVTSIIDPFRGCSNLEQIIVSSGNPVYDSRDNCNAIIETNTNTLVSGCKNTMIPNSVTTIGYFAFADCYDLTSVEIPNSVTTIGYGAFYGSGLTSVEIPNSVTTIDVWAFGYCSGLTSVEIPNSVTTIGDNAFYYTNLTTIEIPNSVTSIDVWAFGYCSGLTSVEIPNSVTTIGSSAFCGCYSLTSMIVMADNPPTLGERAFDYVHMDIPIYVPCGSLNAYVNEGWGGFSNFIELCNREITATANPSDGGSITGAGEYEYGSTCTLTAIPNPGYRFANWTENGEVVSSNPTYSFTVTNNRFLVASFVETPFVDLGLPSGRIWANCNVGADAPEDFGDYFAWGETQPKDYYGWGNYQYCHYGEDVGYEPKFTKYCSNPDYGYNGFTDCHWNLLPEDDAATVNWGSDWRMPTTEEWDELFNNTTNTWTTQNGIHGVLFTASNGNTLFLPAAGSRGGSAGIRCSYWSNQNDITNLANCAYEFDYDGSSHVGYYTYSYPPYSCNYLLYRYAGQSVRAVHVRPMYTINVSAYPSDGGTVSGAGIYEKDSICTLTAVANDGYTFTKWTQNGVVVSTDAEYSFTVTSGLEMVAHFSSPSPWTITATANPAEGGAVSVMDGYVFDFENDIVPVSWNTSSDYPWHVESNMQYAGFNGSYYLCSGNNGVNNSNSSISATVNYTSDGIVSFLVGCWGEGSDSQDYDKCRFYIDDVLKFDYGSHQTWEEIVYVVSAGEHTFTWTYKKDDSFDSTGDFFGIDNVVFSYDSNCTLTATPATGYEFTNWTENGTEVSTDASYSFTVTGDRNLVANFTDITGDYHWFVNVNQYPSTMAAVGIILINGVEQTSSTLELGAFCGNECRGREMLSYVSQMNRYLLFLTLYGNNGDELSFRLYDHALGQELDATCATTVTFAVNNTLGTAASPYAFSFNDGMQTQTTALPEGWTWWGTYIEQNGIDGLTQLENSLGTNGIMIKSQSSGFVTRYGDIWMGLLSGINNESSYLVETSASCDMSISGDVAYPSSHPITLPSGWSWIGYPCNTAMSVSTALSNLNPIENDMLKSQESFSVYYPSIGWFGSLNTVTPGMGLLFESHNTEPVTLVYPNPTRTEALVENVTTRNNHWKPNVQAYPHNMSVMAVVELDGEELQSERYELSAFANGECRGSAKLMYVEPLHRYMAFLTLHGNDEAELRFGLYDSTTGMTTYESDERLVFVTNAVAGSPSEPMVVSFRSMTGVDSFGGTLYAFPNPVKRGSVVHIGTTAEQYDEVRVEIVNVWGVVLSAETSTRLPASIKAPEVAGIYMLRITSKEKGVSYTKLIVR